jgi:hypothetical protein
MTRRNVIKGVAASALAGAAEAQSTEKRNVYLELKYFELRTTPEAQTSRVSTFLQEGYGPALDRNGGKLVGAFSNLIGMEAPYIVALSQFSSLSDFQNATAKLASDAAYQKALSALDQGQGYPYARIRSSLLKSFDGMPQPLLTEGESASSRVFELRRYESQSEVTLARKVKMFNDGEIGIFQRIGMRPVFFGETIVGERMPNLVYMLSFDNLAAREQLWKQFGSDPGWKKLSSPPELHDDQIVSNISNTMLQPLKFSLIR